MSGSGFWLFRFGVFILNYDSVRPGFKLLALACIFSRLLWVWLSVPASVIAWNTRFWVWNDLSCIQ